MLFTVKTLKGYKLSAIDGDMGQVKEFYFDDRHWTIRYLVANTGSWLRGKQVLISPYALGTVDKDIFEQQISIHLTKKQIEDSPPLDSDKPVSRQFEESYYGYYDWPFYWAGAYSWGVHQRIAHDRETRDEISPAKTSKWDADLRSTQAVTGYHVRAIDGEIGHVEDFIVDDETWAIRYLMINTHNFWPGKKVLISPQWLESVSWGQSKVFINLSRETIRHAPQYTEEFLLTRDYEMELHQYYHRQGYWLDELATR